MAADTSSLVQNGYALLNSGFLDQAAGAFQQALAQTPDDPVALSGMAAVRSSEGNQTEALDWSARALAAEPGNIDILLSHAQYQLTANRMDEARRTLSGIKLSTLRDAQSLYDLGVLQIMLGDHAEAKKSLFKANKLEAGNPDLLYALGAASAELGDVAQAEKYLGQCLEASPAHAGAAHLQLGNLFFGQRQLDRAAAHLEAAVAAEPAGSEALVSLSAVRFRQGDTDAAIDTSRRALAIDPEDASIRINLARYLSVQNDLTAAVEEAAKAFELAPDDSDIGGTLYQFLRQACLWEDCPAVSEQLDRLLSAAQDGAQHYRELPFVNVFRVADGRNNLDVARHRIQQITHRISRDGFSDAHRKRGRQAAKSPDQPIRIGYLSSDFRDHPTAHLMQNFFALHDRERFHISAYSHGPDDRSDYRRAIEAGCDEFHDIAGLGDRAAAEKIAGDKIDILVDLNVHITGERMEICAHRPAPIQVNMLAFPGTSGADFYDYLIGDDIVTPSDEQSMFSEHIIYMPETYFLTNHAEEIAAYTPPRESESLPSTGAVFACFNNAYKIEPDMFETWLGILTDVPDSVLWLFSNSALVREKLTTAAVKAGIDGRRLVFAADKPKADHLARLKLADIALDTGIYGGHTTTADALRVGLPVITTSGTHFASRASSSIIRAMGLETLICPDLDSYRAFTVSLAEDEDRLRELRTTIEWSVDAKPLFDGVRYVRHLEAGFAEAHRLWRTGEPPAHILTAGLLSQG